MASQELVDYVKERRGEGFSDDNIRTVLLNAGYNKETVEEALRINGGSMSTSPSPQNLPASSPSLSNTATTSASPINNQSPTPSFFSELFAIYRSRVWVSLGIFLLSIIVEFVVVGVVSVVAILGGIGVGALLAQLLSPAIFILFIFIGLVIALLNFYIQSIFGLALLNTNLHYDERLGVFASLRSMPKKAFPYLWILVLSFLIIAGGFVLAIIPGIFLTIAFLLAGPVFLMEDQRSMDALLRSRDLIKGHWWYSFGCLLAVGIIPFALQFLLIFLGAKLSIAFFILAYLIGFFSIPLFPMAAVVLYKKFQPEQPNIIASPSGRKWKYGILAFIPFIAAIVFVMFILPKLNAGSLSAGSLSVATSTYTNDQYHFSMIIPADDLNITTSTNQSGVLQTIFHPTFDPASQALTFEFYQYGSGSLDNMIDSSFVTQTSSLQIDNEPALRASVSVYGIGYVEYVIQHNGAFYEFTQGSSMPTNQFDAVVQSVTFTSASQHQYSDAPALPMSLSPGPSDITSYYPIQQEKDGVSSMGILPIVIKNNSDEDIALTSVTLSESVSPTNANTPFNTATLLQAVPENSSQSPAISSAQDFSLESSGIYAVTLQTIGQIVIPAGASSQFSFQVQMYGADANPLSSKVGVKFYVAVNSVSGYGIVSNAKLNQIGSATELPMTIVPFGQSGSGASISTPPQSVSPAPIAYKFSNINLPAATIGQYYKGSVDFNQCSSYEGNTTPQSLPAGLSMGGPDTLSGLTGQPDQTNSCRIFILGTPTQAGNFTFQITLNDNSSFATTQSFNLQINSQ